MSEPKKKAKPSSVPVPAFDEGELVMHSDVGGAATVIRQTGVMVSLSWLTPEDGRPETAHASKLSRVSWSGV
jgi:hypothetical protein